MTKTTKVLSSRLCCGDSRMSTDHRQPPSCATSYANAKLTSSVHSNNSAMQDSSFAPPMDGCHAVRPSEKNNLAGQQDASSALMIEQCFQPTPRLSRYCGLWPAKRSWLAAAVDISRNRIRTTNVPSSPDGFEQLFVRLARWGHCAVVAPQTKGIITIEECALQHSVPLRILPRGMIPCYVVHKRPRSSIECACGMTTLPMHPLFSRCLYNPLAVL